MTISVMIYDGFKILRLGSSGRAWGERTLYDYWGIRSQREGASKSENTQGPYPYPMSPSLSFALTLTLSVPL